MVEDVIAPCLQIGLSVAEITGAGFGVFKQICTMLLWQGAQSDNG